MDGDAAILHNIIQRSAAGDFSLGSLEDALIATGIQSVSDLDFTITTMISAVTLPASDKVHAFLYIYIYAYHISAIN